MTCQEVIQSVPEHCKAADELLTAYTAAVLRAALAATTRPELGPGEQTRNRSEAGT